MRSRVHICLLAVAAMAHIAVPALAAEDPIAVTVNMAHVFRLSAPAATVVIGNPGVADVTIQDPQTLILTGKSYGQTNMIVLDANGEPVTDRLIDVVQGQADVLTVYQGGLRTSLVCSPNCQQIIMIGDDSNYTSNVIASSNLVQGAAQ